MLVEQPDDPNRRYARGGFLKEVPRLFAMQMMRTAYEKKERDRCLYRIPFLGAMGVDYVSCRDTVENMATALIERVAVHETANGFEPPKLPLVGVVGDRLGCFFRQLRRFALPTTPVPLLEYPATVYSGRKLALYTRAAQKVSVTGALPKYAHLNTFLKHEKLLDGAKRVVPRVIQPRQPEYNVSVGRYLHHLEPRLYNDIARVFGQPVVMKGYNAFQVGKMLADSWFTFRDPIAVGLDASRFDQHICADMLRWEHSVYTRLYYPSYHELATLLSFQLKNKGFARLWDGLIKYWVDGGRCSGDMNTAMGNCLVMTAAIYGLLHHTGMLLRDGTTKVHLFNNGDDCVLIGERSDVELVVSKVPEWFDALGIVMKVEGAVEALEQVSFCQTRPVYDGKHWRVVREVQQSFSKDCYLLDNLSATLCLKDRMASIGLCGLSLTQGMPILQSYYLALQRGGGARNSTPDERFLDSGFYRLSKGIRCNGPSPITTAARVSFARAFGMEPDLQVALERVLETVDLTGLKSVVEEAMPVLRYF